jgi:hypothetical protein
MNESSSDPLQEPLLSEHPDPDEEASPYSSTIAGDAQNDIVVDEPDAQNESQVRSDFSSLMIRLYHATALPDHEVILFGRRLVDGESAVKLLKFLGMTFASVALMHAVVVDFVSDRDRWLTFTDIWVFEGDAIIRDCVVFFVVGRLWRKKAWTASVGFYGWSWQTCISRVNLISPG